MTSSYDTRGRRVAATVVELGPNFITQINPSSIQLGWGMKKSIRKPQIGHLKKAGLEEKVRFFREVRAGSIDGLEPGKQITVGEIFGKGDAVKVTGTSKGKGFQGGVRRHGFHGGPKTHGQSDRHRAPGSIGSGTTPGRVLRGKKMAGHMGNVTVSYKGLEVLDVDKVNNLITIKGGVPGPIGGLVIIEKQGRIKGYTPPPEEKPSEEEAETSEGDNPSTGAQDHGESKEPEVAKEATKEKAEDKEQENAS